MVAEKRLRDARQVVRWHVITYQTKKQYKFSFCILYPVCSPQSALYTDRIGIPVFLYERALSPDRNIGARIKIIVRLSWPLIDMWTVSWRAHEEKYNDRAIITLYQLKTNANARLTNMATSDALSRGHTVCWNEPATRPPGVIRDLKIGRRDELGRLPEVNLHNRACARELLPRV